MTDLHGRQVIIPGKNGHGIDKPVRLSNEVDGKVRIILGCENSYLSIEDFIKAWDGLFPVHGKHGGTF